ncbi:N-acetylmuramoyl-L-alanine amidase AmiA [Yokenella regensburgei]|uniref:N-acetylmuramoyl-L-alanine amidase AmiA n=1 Tax=Yokenella regensburgei TaxID=158877 RepID=UPI003ED958FB
MSNRRREFILTMLAVLITNAFSEPLVYANSRGILLNRRRTHTSSKRKKLLVIIDPGHGGIDSGAVGHQGSLEKHVVLEVANNVKNMLKGHGIDAVLTRSDDTFIPLYERVQIAHAHTASLFISIHADGFTSPTAHGASVFALSTRGASSAMAKYLAKSENAADEVAGNRAMHKDKYLDRIIFDLEQTETIKESLLLGSHIVRHISPVHPMHSRQTEQAAFVVLKSPYIPSVLVETSFITNPEEEILLGTTTFRHKIASAITNGVVSYFNHKQRFST